MMSDEVDFEHVATVFGVMIHAHEHGLPYRNIFMAAKKELDAIEEGLAPRTVMINVGKSSVPIDPVDDEETEEDDE